ncbi:hypothetical protein ABFS82_06G184900 [Erythranthe guttata]|uniref:S-protein homolog n=1 Tax=Erythranthe guttata TaxID=4155 RepID=A0A022RHI8_ERYGU|nr:hypothetical protein MIMGU_mgv1a018626mg [Erythranthe guttata]
MKNIITCLVLLANILSTVTSSCLFSDQYEVHVVNKMPLPKLKLHCASGDNDLGGNHFNTPNFDFHWKFCENVLRNTLYFCHLSWGNKEVAFDAFKSKKTECPNGVCYYEARSDGIYFAGWTPDPRVPTKVYDWKNHTGKYKM